MFYDENLIDSYINKSPILNRKRLENDPNFMLNVIKKTNDKMFYYFCSNSVKHDYNFVSYLLNHFSNSVMFCDEVLRGYIVDEIDVFELKHEIFHIYDQITSFKNSSLKRTYNNFLNIIYKYEKLVIEDATKDEEMATMSDEIGLGFVFILSEYTKKTEQMFFARKMLKDIFSFDVINDIVKNVHSKFRRKDDFLEYGINHFIIDFIQKYDIYLADFVQCNINLLTDVKKQINMSMTSDFVNNDLSLQSNSILDEKTDIYEMKRKNIVMTKKKV